MTRLVVVVGDGPAGCAAATAAARSGRRTTLVGHGRTHPSGTLELLSARATAALVKLGWYDAVTARATPCEAIVSRWEGDGYAERSAILEPGGLGWIVDRSWFDPLVRTLAGWHVMRAAHAPSADVDLVIATGRHARGPHRRIGPDQATLSVALPTGLDEALTRRLVVEACADGWWSALDDGISLTVTYATVTTGPIAGRAGVGELWRDALSTAPTWVPRCAADVQPRLRLVRSGLAVPEPGRTRVGDAALAVDPLSGHGLTLALHSGLRCLHEGYLDWLTTQADTHELAGRAMYTAAGLGALYAPEDERDGAWPRPPAVPDHS